MSIFKHRFTVKNPEKNIKEPTSTKHGRAVGIDGAQAGESILSWEKGTIYRREPE